jgi:zinc protease
MRRFIPPALIAGLFLVVPVKADEPLTKVGTVEGITEYKLPNGLRVILLPDASKPIVTVNCTIFVGSRHEGYGETGMAHLLEHMLFKGTPTHPNIPKALRDHGAGRFNGTTWYDRTNYYETMPATDENLEFGIQLEADRLINSYVKREDLLSEMTVVRNEFEAGENSPVGILKQRMMAVAYEWHNYGKLTIGNRSDIERVPIESLQAFYRKYYQPDNAMISIAGQFDEKKALDLVVKYFGPLKKPTRKLDQTYTEEPPQDGERNVILRRVGSIGATGVLYHIPSAAHEDTAAIEVLEDCLTNEPRGRVYKALVEAKKASVVSGTTYTLHDPGLVEITARVEDPTKVDAARDALVETVEAIGQNPITDEEVTKSKERFQRYYDDLLAATTGESFAYEMSNWAGAGDWRLFFLNRDRVEKVTAADVNRVAQKYFIRSNRTVGVFYPTKQPERAHIPDAPAVAKLLEGYKGKAAVAEGESFDPSPENIEKHVSRGTLGPIKTAFLPKKTRGEMVELELNLRYGNEESLTGKNVAADLMAPMMHRGTAKHTRQQIHDELDKLKAQVSFGGQAGLLVVGVKVKKANLEPTLKIVAEILREASFPEAELTVLKSEKLLALNNAKTEPGPLAVNAVQRKIQNYPKENIRYVPTIAESIERMKAVTLDQVKEVYQRQLAAQAGELAAVGDFDPKVVTTTLGPALNGWKSDVAYKRIDHPARPIEKGETIKIETPDKANAIYLAALSYPMTDADPDYPALEIGNFVLGEAPLASRLAVRVRQKEGLSYGVGSNYQAHPIDKAASFTVFAITNPKNMGKVDVAIAEEVEKFLKDGVSLDELQASKKGFLDARKVERTEDGALASELATGLFVGRTFQFIADEEKKIAAATPAEISKAFAKVLDPKKLVIVEAGDFAKAGKEKDKEPAKKETPKGATPKQ